MDSGRRQITLAAMGSLLLAVGAQAAGPVKAKEVATPPGDRGLAWLASVRKAVTAARKAGDTQDLGGAMLTSIANLSLVNALHGHFAMAGVGHALRSGGMPAKEVLEFAKNMQSNFHFISQDYDQLAAQKGFDDDLRGVFRSLQILATRAEQAAAALVSYAEAPTETSRAHVFEAALEDYRSRVQGFYAALKDK
jgi:hypothetical protein